MEMLNDVLDNNYDIVTYQKELLHMSFAMVQLDLLLREKQEEIKEKNIQYYLVQVIAVFVRAYHFVLHVDVHIDVGVFEQFFYQFHVEFLVHIQVIYPKLSPLKKKE